MPTTYEIHEVSQLTGLTPARLRAWERRYAVVRPERQSNGYRAYSSAQVALLRAFARRVAAGERIGDLASRPPEEILAEEPAAIDSPVGALADAVSRMDRDGLEALAAQQLALRGLRGFAEEIVTPLAQSVGDLWALGRIPVAAEHMASEVVVPALKSGLRIARGSGPVVLAACVPGERHEWGLLATLARIHDRGFQVQYLGPDLPLDDAVEAAWRLTPAFLALSVSEPARLAELREPLSQLPGRLPPGTVPVIGGHGTHGAERQLEAAGFRLGLDAFLSE